MSLAADRLNRYSPLLAWLQWNAAGRRVRFANQLTAEAEIDTTTRCSGLPSCAADCTYKRSRNLGLNLSPKMAASIFDRLRENEVRRVIFSGGGENLEPDNISSFLEILRQASGRAFEVVLLTNGSFLSAEVIPEVLPHLSILRISFPPTIFGYDHLRAITPQLEAAFTFRAANCIRKPEMVASLLIRPDTPIDEIRQRIELLTNLGFDAIRIKPTHVWENQRLVLRIDEYAAIVRGVQEIGNSRVVVSKIDRLLSKAYNSREYANCYWSDWHSFVVGADGKRHACCETKYRPEFLRGTMAFDILGQPSQPVLPFCFPGCKGDLANRFLWQLVKGYEKYGNMIFTRPEFQEIGEAALNSLVRSALQT